MPFANNIYYLLLQNLVDIIVFACIFYLYLYLILYYHCYMIQLFSFYLLIKIILLFICINLLFLLTLQCLPSQPPLHK